MFRRKILGMVLLVGMLVGQAVPRAHAQTSCDQAQFVSDLTAPDGAAFAPGAAFTKTWRLANIGTCTWTSAYNLVWAGWRFHRRAAFRQIAGGSAARTNGGCIR